MLWYHAGSKASDWLQVDAATSIANGDLTYDNARKAIFGFNQGTEGRHLLSEAVKVSCPVMTSAAMHASVDISPS